MLEKYFKIRLNRIIVQCTLGIIILSLILTTIHNYINQDYEKYIATVNGEKINLKIFQNMYSAEIEKQKKILGKNFFQLEKNKKFVENTYNYILSQLINSVLLEQYTKKIQLYIDDSEIKRIILDSPLFQKNKQFSKEKYFHYLASVNLTNQEYIDIIRKKLNIQHLITILSDSNFILEDEKKNVTQLLSQKRIIQKSIIKINPEINKQHVTNKEAKSYFSRNLNNFYIPEKFKISFVHLKSNQFKKTCNNQEIKEWYTKNIKKYSIPEKRKYSIIQIKSKKEALLVESKLHDKPQNFSKIAREKSTDPISSKNGGDIGWIFIDSIPHEIHNAHIDKKNEISSIIPFKGEFLIVKLDDIENEKQKKIDEVYDIIKKEVEDKKSLDSYRILEKRISSMVQEKPNQFDLILEKNRISAQETQWFDKKSIPNVLNIPVIKKIIFNKKLINNNKIINNTYLIILKNNQSFLIKIKDFQNRKMQIFKNVQKNIINKLKLIKAVKETRRKSEKIISELNAGKENILKKEHLYFTNPETISRYDKNPIAAEIFSLPHPKQGNKTYVLYQDQNKNFIIILLKEVKNANFSQEERDIIVEYLEKNNTEIALQAIINDLREKSTIQYHNIEK